MVNPPVGAIHSAGRVGTVFVVDDMARTAAIIGLGEVGRVFVEDLRAHGISDVRSWDTAFHDPTSRAGRNALDLGLDPSMSLGIVLDGADLVVSAVTAANCVAAATEASRWLQPEAWFVDLNSASPAHKQAAASAVGAVGGRYVEVALMSPIEPRRLAAPFLLGGPQAGPFLEVAQGWGILNASVASGTVGRAAATKLCRSVIVKGLEALFTESLVSARGYGVEREVLASLSNILPPADWESIAGYFIGRSVVHGVRRAEEMEEAAATVTDAGIEPWMSRATVARQRWAAQQRSDVPTSTVELLDALRARCGLPVDGHGDDAAL